MSTLVKLERGHWEENVYRTRDFELKEMPGCGYTFPVDESGNIVFSNDGQRENYEACLEQAEKFVDLGVVEHRDRYKTDDIAVCSCGEMFRLFPEYLDACECPRCGQWYSVGGYPLLPPDKWGDGGAY